MKKLQYGFLALCLSASALMAQDKLEQLEPEATKKIELSKTVSPQGTNSTNATTAVASYDFTTGSDKYYGGAAAAIEVETGVWAMIAGDADGSGSVDASDRSATWNERNTAGYLGSDLNLSGTVDASDRSKAWNNRNKSTSVPN